MLIIDYWLLIIDYWLLIIDDWLTSISQQQQQQQQHSDFFLNTRGCPTSIAFGSLFSSKRQISFSRENSKNSIFRFYSSTGHGSVVTLHMAGWGSKLLPPISRGQFTACFLVRPPSGHHPTSFNPLIPFLSLEMSTMHFFLPPHITLLGSKGGLEQLGSISELSSAVTLLRLKNAIALLSLEMLPRRSTPSFDPGRVLCTLK